MTHTANAARKLDEIDPPLREVAHLPAREEAPPLVDEANPEPAPPIARRDAPAEAVAAPPPAANAGRGRKVLRAFLMLFGIVAVVVGGAAYWLSGGRWVSTDDAYLRSPKLMVSTDVSGIVDSVDVAEGQRVKAGDVLFRVDQKQFEIALAAAKAQLDNTRVNLTAARSDYAQLQAGIAAQEAQTALAKINSDRASALFQSNAGTKAAYDQARYTYDAARGQLEALRRQAEGALVRLGGSVDQPIESHPLYVAALTAVNEAQRQLDHTVVRAPFDGFVTEVDKLQPGTFLVSQTAALTNTGAVALVGDAGIYVEANVKETDLTYVKVGDPVEVSVDAYPGQAWKGRVESISPASGSEFALIPAQNASGNWVKVVQRLALRLSIDQAPGGPQLRSGMSVTANIDTGHSRHVSDLWPWPLGGAGDKAHAAKP